MTVTQNDLAYIENRNVLRRQASLPRLDVPSELERLAAAREHSEFEMAWEKRRPEFAKWIGEGKGFSVRMGRFTFARQQVRKDQS